MMDGNTEPITVTLSFRVSYYYELHKEPFQMYIDDDKYLWVKWNKDDDKFEKICKGDYEEHEDELIVDGDEWYWAQDYSTTDDLIYENT